MNGLKTGLRFSRHGNTEGNVETQRSNKGAWIRIINFICVSVLFLCLCV